VRLWGPHNQEASKSVIIRRGETTLWDLGRSAR
jgi:hypothetical protein